MTKFINFYAGPGAGKSTLAAGVFYEMKMIGYNVEIVPEFAKDLVWEKRHETLSNQVYVNARQFHMIKRLVTNSGPDFIICDSPILLGLAYTQEYPSFYHEMVKWCHSQVFTSTLDFFVSRKNGEFTEKGRIHSEDESIKLDEYIKNELYKINPNFKTVDGKNINSVKIIMENFK